MKMYAKSALFLGGVAALYLGLMYGLSAGAMMYVQRLGCGCGVKYPPLLLGTVAVDDFLIHRYWVAYPMMVAALLPLWLRQQRRKRLAGLKPPESNKLRLGVWPPAPRL